MRSARAVRSLACLVGLITLCAAANAAPQEQPLRIAVLTVQPSGDVRAYRAEELEERLRLHVPVVVLSQSLPKYEISRQLRLYRLSDETRTAAGFRDLAHALSADYLVLGGLSRQNGKYTVALQLVEGASGETVSTARRTFDNTDFPTLLGEPLRSLLSILFAGVSPRSATAAAAPMTATRPLSATPVRWLTPAEREGRLRETRLRLCRDMIEIPAGRFVMGSDSGNPDERPRQYLFVEAFYIDPYEVTNADYAEFMEWTGHAAPPHWKNAAFPEGEEKYPICNVSFTDAQAFASWAGKRLPSEREWEKAARGQDGRVYSWGDVFDASLCNTWESGIGAALPVDAYPGGKSPYGLWNTVGNVWEWVGEWYQPYPQSTYTRPEFGDKYRVLRGGAWNMSADYARCPARYYLEPDYRHLSFGFRCALSKIDYDTLMR